MHSFRKVGAALLVCSAFFAGEICGAASNKSPRSDTGWIVVRSKDGKKPGMYWREGKTLRLVQAGEVIQLVSPEFKTSRLNPAKNLYEVAHQKIAESNADVSTQSPLFQPEHFPTIAEVDDVLYLLWPYGRSQRLSPPSLGDLTAEVRVVSTPSKNLRLFQIGVARIEDKGRFFTVIVQDYRDKFEDAPVSDVVIVRDDGKIVAFPIAIGEWADSLAEKFSLADGILTVRGTIHKIDLRAFEEESLMVRSLKSLRMIDGAGEKVNALQVVNEFFPDVMADPKLNKTAFKIDAREFVPLVEAYHSRMIGSAVVLGPAGVGKTEYLRSFFAAVKRGEVPGIPRTLWVPHVDLASTNAGTQHVGVFEARLAALLKVAELRPTVLMMDEIHGVRGAGAHQDQKNDVFQTLKPKLANGSIHIFGTDTPEEFDAAFSGDAALTQRFGRIMREEFERGKSLSAIQEFFMQAAGQVPADAVIEEIYLMATDFNAVDANPRKSNRLADKLQARMKISGGSVAAMSVDDVRAAAQEMYGVDPAYFSEEGRKIKLTQLRPKLDEYLVGHDHAKDVVTNLTLQAYTQTHDQRRPRLRILLAGDRGLGKTEFGFAYARALAHRFHRVEMNRFEDTVGAAQDLRREIASELVKDAFTVFVVDELEKAPLSVQNALLGILDDGLFSVRQKMNASDQQGTLVRVSARNASFILTTNAGKHLSYGQSKSGGKLGFSITEEEAAIGKVRKNVELDLVQDGLSPYIVDRVQSILVFQGFSKEQFRAIVRMHVGVFLREQSERRGRVVELPISSEVVIDRLTDEFFHPRVSGREVLRAIQSRLRSWYAAAVFDSAETDLGLCERFLLGGGSAGK